MDLEIRHLRLVSAVADLGSLTRAGDRLHLTQSALSHQLRDIEDRLGAMLFQRAGKRLVLTHAGERLLDSARTILARLDETEETIRTLGKAPGGVLRFATECHTCFYWLPPLLVAFRERFPSMELRIEVEASHHPIEHVLEGAIDLALMCTPVRDRRLAMRPVFRDQVVVVASPRHRLAGRRRVALTDLHAETFYIFPPRHESLFLNQVLIPAGAVPARVEEVKLTEAITELVKANLGVSALARWAVEPLLTSGELVALPIPERGLQRQWTAVMLKHMANAAHIGEFIRLLAAQGPGIQRKKSEV
jgi:LysR family transcriptional regulator for metE and metH